MIGPPILVLVLAVTFLGGAVKGIAGFGFGLVATTVLAQVIPARQAIALVIIPVVGANIHLLIETNLSALSSCASRFRWFVLTVVVGTWIGMEAVSLIPEKILLGLLGGFTLLFVIFKQDVVPVPGRSVFPGVTYLRRPPGQAGVGTISGTVFGAMNNGTLIVSYLESLDIERDTFIGLLSLTVLLGTVLRTVVGLHKGLFTTEFPLVLSLAAAVTTSAGVFAGTRFRGMVSDRVVSGAVLGLLAVIGLRLVSIVLL